MAGNSILLYGDIGLSWWSDDGITETDVIAGLKELDPTAAEHEVHINSPGGNVGVGLAIMNLLLGHARQMKAANPDFKLVTVCDGYAMSIASVIFMAGDRRVMSLGGIGMIHDAWNGCYGNATEMRKTADTLDLMSANIADVYANRTVAAPKDSPVRNSEFFRNLMKDETYFTGQAMVDVGLATELDTGLQAALDSALTPESMKGNFVNLMTNAYQKRTYKQPTAAASLTNAKLAKQRLDQLVAAALT